MKKKIIKILKNPKIITIVSLIVAVSLIVLAVPTVLAPRFLGWRNVSKTNEQESDRLSQITNNLNVLMNIDDTNIEMFKNLMDKLLPEDTDRDKLRVSSILDKLVKQSKMTLSSMKVIKKTALTPTQTTPTTDTTTGETDAPTSATTPTSIAPTASNVYDINLVAEGSVPSAVKFLQLLELMKRSAKISEISISKDEENETTEVSVNLSLPLGGDTSVPSPEEGVEFSQADEVSVLELISKLLIDATPANRPTGRSDPFR
jgi:hypothetical protein